MARPRINKETITRSINALLKAINSKSSNATANLSIYLVLTLNKIPHGGRSVSFSLPLPHPIHSPISLIFDDRPNKPNVNLLPLPSIQTTIQSLSLPLPISIIPFSEIRSQGKTPTGLLFVDRRIKKLLLPSSSNNNGSKKKKDGGGHRREIVELDLGKKWWAEEVRRRVNSTALNFRGGTCCGIKVGTVGMAREDIAENVYVTADRAVENVPKKWANVRAFHVKAAESLALPIYDADEWRKRKGEGLEAEEEKVAKRSKVGA